MAVQRKKETENKHEFDVVVKRAQELKSGDIALDLEVNGVTIYGCFYVTRNVKGEDKSFITFPSRKGNDGKYYKHVYFPISDDKLAEIEKDIEANI